MGLLERGSESSTPPLPVLPAVLSQRWSRPASPSVRGTSPATPAGASTTRIRQIDATSGGRGRGAFPASRGAEPGEQARLRPQPASSCVTASWGATPPIRDLEHPDAGHHPALVPQRSVLRRRSLHPEKRRYVRKGRNTPNGNIRTSSSIREHRLAPIATIFVPSSPTGSPRPIISFALLPSPPRTRPGPGRASSQLMHSTIWVAFMATLSRH